MAWLTEQHTIPAPKPGEIPLYDGMTPLEFVLRQLAEQGPETNVSPFQSYIGDIPEEVRCPTGP